MNEAINSLLAKYKTVTEADEINALKEVIQEIALLGLWRAKFFEKAAFYGGSALRILFGLNRFSEDLDFSLLDPDVNFDISSYEKAIIDELNSYDFEVEVESKPVKGRVGDISSAFIKANTMIHLLKIGSQHKTHRGANLKIKLEVDTNPPEGFTVDVNQHFQPIPFSIKTYSIPDLFAGKLHACLCRSDRVNIKGRDWYDFLWYISRGAKVNLKHLQKRMEQTGHFDKIETLSIRSLQDLLIKKSKTIDFERAKRDVEPFIKNQSDLDAWSTELFVAASSKISEIDR